MDEEVRGRDVFKGAFAAFGEGGTETAGYDDVIGGFGEEGVSAAGNVGFGGGEVGGYLGEAGACCWKAELVIGGGSELSERTLCHIGDRHLDS